MIKQAPSPRRLAAMAAFALSCFLFGLLLWRAFGGSIPLQPEGYRNHVRFPQATLLVPQADVRIAGVSVGKVVAVSRGGDRADAEIELASRYAPLGADARAILRQKTLLGETYVELTPGSIGAPRLRDGAELPDAQVQPTVGLDEVLRAINPSARHDLRIVLHSLAGGVAGRAASLSSAVGNLAPTTASGADLLAILDAERTALRRLVRDSATVFATVGERATDVQTVIDAGNAVLATTAARNRDLTATVKALPGFVAALHPALTQVGRTASALEPAIHPLRAVAPLLTPTLRDTATVAPALNEAFARLDPLLSVATRALPALTRTLRAAGPLIDQLDPASRELVPVVDYLSLYKRELITSWAKAAAATQGALPDPVTGAPVHYLRVLPPLSAETLGVWGQRLGSNRHNPYDLPGSLEKLATGLESFDCQNAGHASVPGLDAAPPCKTAPPLAFRGSTSAYPQLERDPPQR
jgi:phospholipid/cholesterol/gamma-HCH transport system substrate-binding protein